ncbi:MAG: ABC-type transport auxiliary lipoprotein family protein [Nitrospira sp.]|jgi:cholesterol transport system auxiliary component|nr:ABC-type transport auxiliary lipoprotein family protein [Nitrospira sp.]
MMRFGVIAVLVAWMAVGAGCLSPRGDALPLHTYQLVLGESFGEARPADSNGPSLLVSPAQAEPGFETPRMVFFKRLYEVEYFAQSQWADAPARMLTSLLIQSLDRSGSWRAVLPLPGAGRGDYRLDSSGFAVQQEFLQQPSRVRMTVRTQLIDLKESRVVGARTFEALEDAPSGDAYGGVVAANRAMAALLDQIGAWLQGCVRRAPVCGRS